MSNPGGEMRRLRLSLVVLAGGITGALVGPEGAELLNAGGLLRGPLCGQNWDPNRGCSPFPNPFALHAGGAVIGLWVAYVAMRYLHSAEGAPRLTARPTVTALGLVLALAGCVYATSNAIVPQYHYVPPVSAQGCHPFGSADFGIVSRGIVPRDEVIEVGRACVAAAKARVTVGLVILTAGVLLLALGWWRPGRIPFGRVSPSAG